MRVPIKDTQGLLHKIAPRPDLPLFVGSPRLPFPGGVVSPTGQPRRVSAYLFFFMIDGQSVHNLDMEEVHLTGGRVLFVQPNQIHQSTSGWSTWKDWYKIVFDEYCLALLPRSYHFLQDPFNSPLVTPGKEALARLGHSLEAMAGILFGPQPYSIDLALAYLNAILTELDECYFKQLPRGRGEKKLDTFFAFRRLVERDFRSQPPIAGIARELSVSENKLYSVVRQYTGLSPKAFLLRRTLLEAQRLFYYDRAPVKEVAYDLGFGDPDHFSRLFRDKLGKTATDFLKQVQDLSGK